MTDPAEPVAAARDSKTTVPWFELVLCDTRDPSILIVDTYVTIPVSQ